MKCSRVAGMTLSELLTRKMQDYGYKTLTALGNDVGMQALKIHHLLNGKVLYPRKETRVKLCQVLDIAPEVLDRAIRNSMGGYK